MLAACVGLLVAFAPGSAAAQAGDDEAAGVQPAEESIEWNFRPQQSPAGPSRSDLEARWAAPFAVESLGRPAPRESREVVVVRGRPLLVAADSGETAAVVEVEEGNGLRNRVLQLARTTQEMLETSGVGEDAVEGEPEDEGEAEGEEEPEAEVGEVAVAESDVEEGEEGEEDEAGGDGEVEADEPEPAPSRRTHRVERGDTLFGIARRYGVRAADIRAANDMEGDIVRIGETLIIPDEEES